MSNNQLVSNQRFWFSSSVALATTSPHYRPALEWKGVMKRPSPISSAAGPLTPWDKWDRKGLVRTQILSLFCQ